MMLTQRITICLSLVVLAGAGWWGLSQDAGRRVGGASAVPEVARQDQTAERPDAERSDDENIPDGEPITQAQQAGDDEDPRARQLARLKLTRSRLVARQEHGKGHSAKSAAALEAHVDHIDEVMETLEGAVSASVTPPTAVASDPLCGTAFQEGDGAIRHHLGNKYVVVKSGCNHVTRDTGLSQSRRNRRCQADAVKGRDHL